MTKKSLKKYLRFTPAVTAIFNELDQYLNFCREYGHVYDPQDIGRQTQSYQDFQRLQAGKPVRDQWSHMIKQARGHA